MKPIARTVVVVLAVLVALWVLAFTAQRVFADVNQQQGYVPDPAVTQSAPASPDVYGCGTGWVIVTWSSGIGDLFKTKWHQYFCFHHGVVYNVKPLQTNSWTTGLGSDLNWSYTNAGGDRVGKYIDGHRAHKSWANVDWHTCTPLPTGCLPNGEADFNGVFEVFNDGSVKFWRR